MIEQSRQKISGNGGVHLPVAKHGLGRYHYGLFKNQPKYVLDSLQLPTYAMSGINLNFSNLDSSNIKPNNVVVGKQDWQMSGGNKLHGLGLSRLEDHNLQLESQLGKLKMMLHEVCYYFIDNSYI